MQPNSTVQTATNQTNTTINPAEVAESLKGRGIPSWKIDTLAEAIVRRAYDQKLTRTQSEILSFEQKRSSVRNILSNLIQKKSHGVDSPQNRVYDEGNIGGINEEEKAAQWDIENQRTDAFGDNDATVTEETTDGRSEGDINTIENAIPNVESATINPKKLTEYALNPNHPVGGNKAKVFQSALGYNQSNADALMRQVYEKLPGSEAVLGKVDQYGQRYTVDMLITGPNGNTVNVRTGWIIKTGSDIPELTTIYVNN